MAKIPTRQLGKYGSQVTTLDFGMMGLSYLYSKLLSDEERFKVLDRALELGETFWDSAKVRLHPSHEYQQCLTDFAIKIRSKDSEDLLRKWFQRTGK